MSDTSSDDYEEVVCFRCNRLGHFASQCYAKTSIKREREPPREGCFRCGRASHWAGDCYARTMADGSPIVEKRAQMKLDTVTRTQAGVYVIAYPNGMRYVGSSLNVPKRLQEHRSGFGSTCTQSWGSGFTVEPVVTCGSTNDLESWERLETLTLMRMHGVERVRGWRFVVPNMTEQQVQEATMEIREKFDLCRKCGAEGHFAADCA